MPGTLLLDCAGLSLLYRQDRAALLLIEAARREGVRVGTTAMTRLEAEDSKVHRARIAWNLSRLDVHDITREVSADAAELLRSHQLHGHKYAIDATLAAIARRAERPVSVFTSDPEDLTLLCGKRIQIIPIKR